MSESNNHSCGTGLSGTIYDHGPKEAALSIEAYDVECLKENAIRLAKELAIYCAVNTGIVYKAICDQMRVDCGHVHFHDLATCVVGQLNHSTRLSFSSPEQLEEELKEVNEVRIRLFGDDFSKYLDRGVALNHLNELAEKIKVEGFNNKDISDLLSKKISNAEESIKMAMRTIEESLATIRMVKMTIDNLCKNS